MTSLTIVDRAGETAFQLDVTKKKYTFSHDGLEDMVRAGIQIPISCRSSFEGKKIIYLPKDSGTSAEYEQFAQAVCLLYKEELSKSGFQLKSA